MGGGGRAQVRLGLVLGVGGRDRVVPGPGAVLAVQVVLVLRLYAVRLGLVLGRLVTGASTSMIERFI